MDKKTTGEQIRENLPHIYGWPWYRWAHNFYKSTNKMNLLCAANQISKSSTQIRKAIEWSTNQKLWPKLWPRNPVPRNMWYLYPDSKVATIEFESKFIPEFMPRGFFKDHPLYGWKAVYEKKRIEKIVWNNGCTLHFKTYMQNPQSLQSSTVHAIFCFAKGTEIITRDGVRCISSVRVGDEVMSHRGWRRVKEVQKGKKKVITREFSNGQKLTGTADHPIWTDQGWVNLGALTPEHFCCSVPKWKMSLIKRLFCLKAACTSGSLRAKTIVSEIISVPGIIVSCISPFGNLATGHAPKVMSFTTKTITLSTTGRLTYNSCQKQIIPRTTSSKSGRKKNTTRSIVQNAARNLSPGRLSGRFRDIVLRSVAVSIKFASALFAITILKLVRTTRACHVVKNAETPSDSEAVDIYNLNVEDAHTYFSQGLLVHNCDEELPEHLYDELQFRLAGTDGYFHMVFTATLNQQLWWQAMEGKDEQEKFPEAFKQQISMYDCQTYRNGQPGAFNEKRIQEIIKKCKSDNEVKRRVYGRFIADTGRKYPAFDPSRHFVEPFHLDPGKWNFYGGVDPGGGGTGHPAAMGIIAVAPNMRKAYVCRGLRMDGQDTTSGDILNAFRDMRGGLILRNQFYDQASKDFFMVASRAGESFSQSEKSHELGEDIINTLFKNDMLFIFDTGELRKLGQELVTLKTDIVKRKAQDDFIDGAVRYTCTSIPWDWTMLTGTPEVKPVEDRPYTETEYNDWVDEQRRGTTNVKKSSRGKAWKEWESEVAEWNDAYGS